MYAGILCDLCIQADPDAVRIADFYVEAEIHLKKYGRSRAPIVFVDLDICEVCFKKRDHRVVRVKKIRRYTNPLEKCR